MPIINMAFKPEDIPADAINVREYDAKHCGGGQMWLYDTHVGLCLQDRERNGYDDSDFYMIVWNPEKQEPEEITFASTRGWSYPCYGSSPDATPEVRAAYDAYCAERMRRARMQSRNAERRQFITVARAMEIRSYKAVKRLYWATPRDAWPRVVKLLTSKLRSGFRKSLREQIIKWAKEENPQYGSPLSRKQWEHV